MGSVGEGSDNKNWQVKWREMAMGGVGTMAFEPKYPNSEGLDRSKPIGGPSIFGSKYPHTNTDLDHALKSDLWAIRSQQRPLEFIT